MLRGGMRPAFEPAQRRIEGHSESGSGPGWVRTRIWLVGRPLSDPYGRTALRLPTRRPLRSLRDPSAVLRYGARATLRLARIANLDPAANPHLCACTNSMRL